MNSAEMAGVGLESTEPEGTNSVDWAPGLGVVVMRDEWLALCDVVNPTKAGGSEATYQRLAHLADLCSGPDNRVIKGLELDGIEEDIRSLEEVIEAPSEAGRAVRKLQFIVANTRGEGGNVLVRVYPTAEAELRRDAETGNLVIGEYGEYQIRTEPRDPQRSRRESASHVAENEWWLARRVHKSGILLRELIPYSSYDILVRQHEQAAVQEEELGLTMYPHEWYAVFVDVLGWWPRGERVQFAENQGLPGPGERRQLATHGFLLLGRMWNPYRDVKYGNDELLALKDEIRVVESMVRDSPAARHGLIKVLFACREAEISGSGLRLEVSE